MSARIGMRDIESPAFYTEMDLSKALKAVLPSFGLSFQTDGPFADESAEFAYVIAIANHSPSETLPRGLEMSSGGRDPFETAAMMEFSTAAKPANLSRMWISLEASPIAAPREIADIRARFPP